MYIKAKKKKPLGAFGVNSLFFAVYITVPMILK